MLGGNRGRLEQDGVRSCLHYITLASGGGREERTAMLITHDGEHGTVSLEMYANEATTLACALAAVERQETENPEERLLVQGFAWSLTYAAIAAERSEVAHFHARHLKAHGLGEHADHIAPELLPLLEEFVSCIARNSNPDDALDALMNKVAPRRVAEINRQQRETARHPLREGEEQAFREALAGIPAEHYPAVLAFMRAVNAGAPVKDAAAQHLAHLIPDADEEPTESRPPITDEEDQAEWEQHLLTRIRRLSEQDQGLVAEMMERLRRPTPLDKPAPKVVC
jgi:hypothetical protein